MECASEHGMCEYGGVRVIGYIRVIGYNVRVR